MTPSTFSSRKAGRVWNIIRTAVIVVTLILPFTSEAAMPVRAGVAAGYSEYYIPGAADQLYQILLDNQTNITGNNLHNVITIPIAVDNVTLYYDHWENGYLTGAAGDEVYTANRGQVLTFESPTIPANPRGTSLTACAGSTNPNGATNNCYDGRDHIYVVGGAVSVAQAFWPSATGTVYANAWEVYPIKPYMTFYTIPVGENLYSAPRSYPDFQNVYVLIQATQNDTNVVIDDTRTGPGADLTATLNRGAVTQLYGIWAGTTVTSDKPVQVQFIVGQQNASYDSRSFTAVPSGLWDYQYYSPVPSSAGGVENANTNLYVYNPTASALTINYRDTTGNGSFIVPANSTRSYLEMTGRYVPTNSGVYLAAADGATKFWAIGCYDTGSASRNWGFTLLPVNILTNEYYVGWAPGTTDFSANGSPVFVTPTVDNTTIYVDYYPADGIADATYTLNRLQLQKLLDPNTLLHPNDNTGMHIWATNPIAVVWGEDADFSNAGNPFIDAGYTILPMNMEWIDVVLTIDKTANPPVIPSGAGQVSEFTLVVKSDAFGINGVSVTDILPADWAYVAGSTTITLPDGSTITGASADPVISGQNLTWDRFPVTTLDMNPNETLTIIFSAETTATPASGYSTNEAVVTGTVGGTIISATDSDTVTVVNLNATKTSSAGGNVNPGDPITYTITVTNNDPVTQNNIVVTDPLPIGTTYVPGSTQVTFTTVNPPGTITNPGGAPPNLVTAAENYDLATGDSLTIIYQVTVNDPVPAGLTAIVNTASVSSVELPDPIVLITTDVLPPVVIDAVDDAGAMVIGTIGGQSLANVLVNDTLNGDPALLVDVILTQVSTTNPGVTLDVTTGAVNVTPGTPPGNYVVTYQICDRLNPTICDQAIVTVPVAATGLTKSLVADSLAATINPQATIGEIVAYEVTIDVPALSSMPNAVLTDTLGQGLAFVDCESITPGSPSVTTDVAGGFGAVCGSPTVANIGTDPSNAGRQITFNLGTLANSNEVNVPLVVRYRVVVLNIDSVRSGVTLTNDARFTWAGGSLVTSDPTLTVVEPKLNLVKAANVTEALPGTVITFTLTINYVGTGSPAYDVYLTDTVPNGLTYVPGSFVVVSGQPPILTANAPNLRADWAVFNNTGTPTTLQYQATLGNLPGGDSVNNTALLAWSSLPGNVDFANRQSTHNDYSTERDFDPGSLVNTYGVNSAARITSTASIPEVGGFTLIPVTGFAADRVTVLPEQPADASYRSLGSLWLEVPKLGVQVSIVGVPLKGNQWDLAWLGNQAGYLQGTAFPTWKGNSAITAHVYMADGKPGPFVSLSKLVWGDEVVVHAFGQRYVYQVRDNQRVLPTDMTVFRHEELSWVTLITCQGYDQATGDYKYRIAVRAVLVRVEPESSAGSGIVR